MQHDFIDIHCHEAKPGTAQAVVSQYVDTDLTLVPAKRGSALASIGLHPWYTTPETAAAQWAQLMDFFDPDHYFALGECGLDRLRGPALSLQAEILLQHCRLAAASSKPVILHIVRAISDLIAFQKKYRFRIPLIVHGFRGNRYEALQLVAHGFHLSFGEALLHDHTKVTDAFIHTPIDRVFLETDMSDQPIALVYEKAATLKNITLDAFIQTIKNNFEKIQ